MLAAFVLLYLLAAAVCLIFEVSSRSKESFWNDKWRLRAYAGLMLIGFIALAVHYLRINPLITLNKFEVQGQYFPLNSTVSITADPATASYFAPALLGVGEPSTTSPSPVIELSGFDDRTSSLQAKARGTAGPLAHNGQLVNLRSITYANVISIGGHRVRVQDGWTGDRLTIDDRPYKISLARNGPPISLGQLLCNEGLSHAQQSSLLAVANSASSSGSHRNVLDSVWLVKSDWGTVGLINGSPETVTIDGQPLPSELTFTVKSGDTLTYGAGRSLMQLTVRLEPTLNRIYIIPQKPESFPLYRSVNPDDATLEVFVTSGLNVPGPSYQLTLGQNNTDLVKASIKYSFAANRAAQATHPSNNEERNKLQKIYEDGFIVNSGFDQRAYKFGEIAPLGTSAGGILVSLQRKEASPLSPIARIGLIWAVTMVMFGFFGGVSRRNYLFLLLPTVQLMLAIRLILSYRGYVLPPYLGESYEKALMATVFIPLAIFTWLYARSLAETFDFSTLPDIYRRPFTKEWFNGVTSSVIRFVRLPPFIYTLISLALLWYVGALSNGWNAVLTIAMFLGSVVVLTLLPRIGARLDENPVVDWLRSDRRFDILLLFAAPLALAFLLRVLGLGTESLPGLGLRAELFYLPCLLFASCRFLTWLFQERLSSYQSLRWFDYCWFLVLPAAYGVLALIVGDFGFLIYAIPVFLLALIITWRIGRRVSILALAASLVMIGVFLWTPFFSQSVPALIKNTGVHYRFLAYHDPGWLESAALEVKDDGTQGLWHRLLQAVGFRSKPNACETGMSPARRVLGVHEHFWTMFHFAARGTGGEGYGRAPISRVPFPNGISQSDNTYSIYIMSEHGSAGGIALIFLYTAIALLMLFVLSHHFAEDVARNLLIAGVALTFSFTALYHAAGNTGGAPFTGKNMPLLSLNSNADLLLVGLLLAVAISVIANDRSDLGGTNQGILVNFRGTGNALNRWLAVIAGLLLLVAIGVGFQTVRAANDELHRGDYDLEEFLSRTREYLKNRVIEFDPNTHRIELKTEAAVGLADKQYLRLLRDQFNNGSMQEKRSGKYFFMVRDLNVQEDLYGSESQNQKRSTILTFDQNYFRRPSPFATRVFWWAGLRSGDSSDVQDSLSGEGLNLFFEHVLDSDEPYPGKPDELMVKTPDRTGQTSVTIQHTRRRFKVYNNQNDWLFDVYSVEGDTVLEPHAQPIYINGTKVEPVTRLEPGDIIAVGDAVGRRAAMVFMYQRTSSGLLANYRWFNGKENYAYPQGPALAIARPIVEEINNHLARMNQYGEISEAERIAKLPLVLSIHAGLNSKLYEQIVWEAEGHRSGDQTIPSLWDEVNRKQGPPPQVSVTVLNPDNGEVLSIPSWPSHDPNPRSADQEKADQRSYPNLIRRRDAEARRFLLNHNFDRHVLGSATKPFIASAAATAYPELANLAVNDDRAEYDNVLGIPTKPAWQGNAAGRVDWNSFFIQSNNLYEVMIGFLGLPKPDRAGRLPLTGPRISQRFSLGANEYAVQPNYTDIFDAEGKALNLDRTPLASKLSELFDIQVSGPDEAGVSEVWTRAQQMKLLPASGISFISPERPNLSLNNVREARSFVGVCLGGNTNRWSNIKSAEAFARLVTGRRVFATMVRGSEPTTFEPLNQNYLGLRLQLLRALAQVSTNGTARDLAPRIAEINRGSSGAGRRFVVFAKTGTLEGQHASGRNDSNIIFAAGFWNDATGTLTNSVVVSIYIEKGNVKGDSGRATALASRILSVLDSHFKWSLGGR